MKIITAYPVLVEGKTINRGLDFSNMDAKSGSSAIKQFQSWSNKIKGTHLTVDGKWGPKTASAYGANGAEFEKAFTATSNTLANMFNPAGDTSSPAGDTSSPAAPSKNLTVADPMGHTKKGHFWDKAKGIWTKAQDSGAVDKGKGFLGNLFGGTKIGQKLDVGQNNEPSATNPDPSAAPVDYTDTSSPAAKKGLSTPAKVGIGLGVLLLLYVGYRAMKGGKPAKA